MKFLSVEISWLFCFGRAVSDVRLKALIRVSEFASGDVDAVELAQLNKCTQIIA